MQPDQLIEQLWKQQKITAVDVDYSLWTARKEILTNLGRINDSCLFTVDVYQGCYNFASENFSGIFGIKPSYLYRIEEQGDIIEDRTHPEDREMIKKMQIEHGYFIYSLPAERRNDYQTTYQFRMLNARKQYINVISRQRVFMKDRNGKAWIVMGNLNIAPDQCPRSVVRHSVFNIKSGEILIPSTGKSGAHGILSIREMEVLRCLAHGMFGKEIAWKLGISLNTVNNHRKSILAKLNVDNSIEAINRARQAGLLD